MSNNKLKVIDLIVTIGCIGLIGVWCVILLRPFLTLILWSIILAVAFYPIFEWLKHRLGGQKNLAATLIVLTSIAIILGPVALMAKTLSDNINNLANSIINGELVFPPPPENLDKLPIIGDYINNLWKLASVNIVDALKILEPQIKELATYLLPITADISLALLTFLFSIIISAFLMINAKVLQHKLTRLICRITPSRGQEFITLASLTLRNIIRGVMGIAVIQTAIVSIGLIVAGIPAAGLLSLICLILTIIQLGPGLIVFPVIIFAWVQMNSTLMALIFSIWMFSATLVDNVLKPILMTRGLAIPMPVILLGVFGGTVVHGIIGLFIGPVVLTLGYEIVSMWAKENQSLLDETVESEI
jgi:predicted PurR-regulated permease PerM